MISRLRKIGLAVKHLKWIQIYGQLRNRWIAKTFSSCVWEKKAGRLQLGTCQWPEEISFPVPGANELTQEKMLDGEMEFLNEGRNLGWPFDWNPANVSKLWEYNLHYFEYLFKLDYDTGKTLALDWINRCVIRRNSSAWEPYPVSLRIMNWCMYFYEKHRHETEADHAFRKNLNRSLALQTEWLLYRREFHLLGNHYLENASALVLVGSCFEGPDAKRYFECGLKILRRELPEQILSDGMHFERSPMYHSRILYLLQSLMQTDNLEVIQLVEPFYRKASDALPLLCHPDGEIALLNDSAFKIYSHPQELDPDWAKKRLPGNFRFPDAGYYGAVTETGHYLIADVGAIGPDYIPGHAHGDIFSFELSFFGKRMVVDSGVYNYVASPERKYCRSTAAHNTVEINGQDQCEFFDAFKVGFRVAPQNILFQETKSGFQLTGEHNGYCRFPNRATHHRTFHWEHIGRLVLEDRLDAIKNVEAIVRLHLHPDCQITRSAENEIEVQNEDIRFLITQTGGKFSLERFDYSPEFGIKIESTAIALAARGKRIHLSTTIQVLDKDGSAP